MTEQLLLHYTRLVEFLGHVLGPDYEIILHEILPEQSRVAAIANGGISGRDVGAPITNAALRMIMQKQYESNNYIKLHGPVIQRKNAPFEHDVHQGRRKARGAFVRQL